VEAIESEFGKVNVKVSRLKGKIVNFSPEYEECRRIATEQNVPYKWVQSRIIQEFMNRHARDL
jgi:pyridinium-3,5-bisthiocarboxylic acid mononucleotide nickel chelatase